MTGKAPHFASCRAMQPGRSPYDARSAERLTPKMLLLHSHHEASGVARVTAVEEAWQVPAVFNGAEGTAAQVTMLQVRQQWPAGLGSSPGCCHCPGHASVCIMHCT